VEVCLLFLVLFFFLRLKKSEKYISTLQKKQEEFIQKLSFSSELEKKMLETFTSRQKELTALNEELARKVSQLKQLISKAEKFTNSPLFVKQLILLGYKSGETPESLAKTFNLTVEEVELIIEHAN